MNWLDFSEINSLDPALSGYPDKKVYFEDTFEARVELLTRSTIERLNARIFFNGEYSNPTSVSMEITSEKDLFFCYLFECREEEWGGFAHGQKLKIEFKGLCLLLKKMLGQVGKRDKVGSTSAVMDLGAGEEGAAELIFEQDTEFVNVPLLKLPLALIEEEGTLAKVAFKHDNK